jgi:hypothetical protein
MPAELPGKRQARIPSAPYKAKPGPRGPQAAQNAPKSSKLPAKRAGRQNLTLSDWLFDVFPYIDAHPSNTQQQTVDYFSTRASGALQFDATTLGRKVKMRPELEARAKSHPNALSTKRPYAVVRPDVNLSLKMWFDSAMARGEVVTGPMLTEKRRRFEDLHHVPEEERLKSDGWQAPFLKACVLLLLFYQTSRLIIMHSHQIKEIRRHGEAASADMSALAKERTRLQELLKPFALKDIFNTDETGVFLFQQPERGLADRPLAGKKQKKDRITVLFTTNADGSEKLPALYIGKSKQPRCFKNFEGKRRTGQELGFDYHNNKKAWMTKVIFTP